MSQQTWNAEEIAKVVKDEDLDYLIRQDSPSPTAGDSI